MYIDGTNIINECNDEELSERQIRIVTSANQV
jgi:hypothetical protein